MLVTEHHGSPPQQCADPYQLLCRPSAAQPAVPVTAAAPVHVGDAPSPTAESTAVTSTATHSTGATVAAAQSAGPKKITNCFEAAVSVGYVTYLVCGEIPVEITKYAVISAASAAYNRLFRQRSERR